jgi:ABC-2 type transport system permease protein
VTVNIVHWDGHVMFYSLTMGLGDVALSFLVATLGAAIGVLISLRAATVQEAQQIMMAAVMVAPLVLGVIVTAVLASRTGWGERVEEILAAADSWQVVLAAVVALVLVDAGLIRWAMARFQRARLILD